MRNKLHALRASGIAAAIFLFLFLPLGWSPLVAGVIAVGAYFGLELAFRPQERIGGVVLSSLKGGEEMKRLLDEAHADLREIREAEQRIHESGVRENAVRLGETAGRLLKYLAENPAKISAARRFFTYYLDTAAKLLKRYVEFQNTELKTEEVRRIMEKTAESLPTLNKAFDGQFTRLMRGELLNTEADIEVLEKTVWMEEGK